MGDRAYIKFVIFLSTPSARRATLCCTGAGCKTLISIHALREEGDSITVSISPPDNIISIHALREEGDKPPCAPALMLLQFLSTPSARRATAPMCRSRPCAPISIHALREEGDEETRLAALRDGISIHALREEGDYYKSREYIKKAISIHALREEGDVFFGTSAMWPKSFLSTPSARRATSP